jgi:hypothetical protein
MKRMIDKTTQINQSIIILYPLLFFCTAYQHCLKQFGAKSRWMGFFDVDEYLFSPKFDNLWPGMCMCIGMRK